MKIAVINFRKNEDAVGESSIFPILSTVTRFMICIFLLSDILHSWLNELLLVIGPAECIHPHIKGPAT
jgi:hypothetical protein